jgi:hypothetical protein
VEPPPSSHGRPNSSAMARDATASRDVEAARGVGVLMPSRSVWDSGATLHTFQQRRSHEPDSSDPGGSRVWARGSSGWMPGRHIRRGREDTQYKCHNIVKFCSMARRTGGKERALCGKPIEAIQALAQRKRDNKDTARVRLFCRPDQFSRSSYVDDNSFWLVSSLPSSLYTMSSHRDIYKLQC